MAHTPQIAAEIRQLPPQDGWATYEATGRACVTCPCGLNTGWIPRLTASAQTRTHASRGA